MSPRQADPIELDGVAHRWVQANGVRMHVAEAGMDKPGPTLVLIHGWPQHWWCWNAVIPLLAEHHHVVALDLRGHGWSDAPDPQEGTYDKRTLADDVVALIEALDLDRPVLVGHDWGAWVSLVVGSRHSRAVRGVVATAIVAPWATVPAKDLWRFGYQLVVGGPWGVPMHQRVNQWVLRTVFRVASADRRPWPAGRVEPYLERYRHRERAAAGRAMYGTFLTRELPAMQRGEYAAQPEDLPLLFLPGRRDGVLTPDLVRRGVRGPNASMTVIDGAGHWVPEEQPETLAREVLGFVAGLGDR